MAELRTQDEEFKDRYTHPPQLGNSGANSKKGSGGIQNPRVSRNFSDEKYLAKGKRGRQALARRRALSYAPGTSPEEIAQNGNNNPRNQPINKKAGLIKGSIKQNLGRIRSIPIGASILIWSVPYYFTIHLPLAVLSSISLGIAWYLGSQATGSVGIIAPLLEGTGLGHDSFLIIYFGFTIVLLVFNVIELVIGFVQFKLAFLHPLVGDRGAFSKTSFAFLTIIACFIPGLNLFPFFFLWLLFAVINPK